MKQTTETEFNQATEQLKGLSKEKESLNQEKIKEDRKLKKIEDDIEKEKQTISVIDSKIHAMQDEECEDETELKDGHLDEETETKMKQDIEVKQKQIPCQIDLKKIKG